MSIALSAETDEQVKVAPVWKLMWWRFRRHRLAVISAWVLVLIVAVAVVPQFFATQLPEETSARRAFMPPPLIRIMHEGRLHAPSVYDDVGEGNGAALGRAPSRSDSAA